jgi:pyruvate ferredoxin oxidoreductase beta subunit/2-oxoisovalerate ferredoxin oxidoreductase beta subunit
MVLALRYVLKAMAKNLVLVIPPGCAGPTIRLPEPTPRYRGKYIRQISVPFGSATTIAAGLKAALKKRGENDTEVIAWAGDGAIFDIGLGALSGSAERNDDIICVCYDNEGYQNTGKQRSSATPWGATTSTNPAPSAKMEYKKDVVSIVASHGVPYAATATIAYPKDLMRKVEKAKAMEGFRFLHILVPCPTGWGYPSWWTVKVSRLAVRSKVFPLYEVEKGVKVDINHKGKKVPVRKYIEIQKRYRHLTPQEVDEFQVRVDEKWDHLNWLCGYKR